MSDEKALTEWTTEDVTSWLLTSTGQGEKMADIFKAKSITGKDLLVMTTEDEYVGLGMDRDEAESLLVKVGALKDKLSGKDELKADLAANAKPSQPGEEISHQEKKHFPGTQDLEDPHRYS